jgi:hypothetical protein
MKVKKKPNNDDLTWFQRQARQKKQAKAAYEQSRQEYLKTAGVGIPSNTTMLEETTVTAGPNPKPVTVRKKQVEKSDKMTAGDIAENVADDLSGSVTVSSITQAVRRNPIFNLAKKAAQSPQGKAWRRILKRTANIGSRIVAPPMLINPTKVQVGGGSDIMS